MVSGDKVCKVLNFLRQNNNPYSGIDRSYTANIAREMDMSRRSAHDAVQLLVEYGLARRVQDGQKKIIVLEDMISKVEEASKPNVEHPWA